MKRSDLANLLHTAAQMIDNPEPFRDAEKMQMRTSLLDASDELRIPQSIPEFAEACRRLKRDDIYSLFEDLISQELRDEIYTTFWSSSLEPGRAAMIQIGARYCVQSLDEY